MSNGSEIKTIVAFDMETNGLPSEQSNTCAITEITFYAFSAKHLRDQELDFKVFLKNTKEENGVKEIVPPEMPRVIHKLNLMINPGRMIYPIPQQITGLTNAMLEDESTFDETTAECINSFLNRLPKPICLVAHNGWNFDYPILHYVYDKIEKTFPSGIYCIDSLKAFREFDEKLEKIINTDEEYETPSKKLCVRRSLFSDDFKPKTKYPPKGVYKLDSMYARCFKKEAVDLHRSESDVIALTKLMLYYGSWFLAYAEQRKVAFEMVPKLGQSSY